MLIAGVVLGWLTLCLGLLGHRIARECYRSWRYGAHLDHSSLLVEYGRRMTAAPDRETLSQVLIVELPRALLAKRSTLLLPESRDLVAVETDHAQSAQLLRLPVSHAAVRLACYHDVTTFLAEELVFRRGFGYPPVTRLALVRFEAINEKLCRESAEAAAEAVSPIPERTRLRGPAPAPLERIRNHWRWQLLLTAANRELLRELLEKIEALKVPKGVRRIIDVDPASTL